MKPRLQLQTSRSQTGTKCRPVRPLWEAVWRYLKQLKLDLPFNPVTSLLGLYPKKPKTLIRKNTNKHPCVHCSIIFHRQDMEAARVSISRWVGNKTMMARLHNGILLGGKERKNFTLCESLGGPGEHYAKWNKPVRERQTPYDFTHVWNLMSKLD